MTALIFGIGAIAFFLLGCFFIYGILARNWCYQAHLPAWLSFVVTIIFIIVAGCQFLPPDNSPLAKFGWDEREEIIKMCAIKPDCNLDVLIGKK